MAPELPFVDIHCHLLPGIDDGAGNWSDSLAMARLAAADGIGTIVATPHQLGNYSGNRGAAIRALVAELQARLDEAAIPLRVLPGGDVRIEPQLTVLVRSGEVLSLADRRRHVLLELPHELYLPLDKLLAELAAANMVGILSHPERNQGLLAQPRLVGPLIDAGCLMQITAGSLLGAFGPACREFSEQLLAAGQVHFVATDAHGTKSRRPLLAAAWRRLAELTDEPTATCLCCQNPAAVAAGEDVPAARPNRAAPRRTSWFPWRRTAC